MHPYYLKILIWVCLHLVTTFSITYIVIHDINTVIVLTSGQLVVMLSVYPPFEYYYTWSHETLCLDD
jgi:hypothetical protein